MLWMIVLVLIGLIAFPERAAAAAAEGATSWWLHVVPALTPHLVLTGLLLKSAPAGGRCGPFHPVAVRALLLGAAGGYPAGARVIGAEADLTDRQRRRFLLLSSLPNPAFLISVVAVGLFGRSETALPLCGAVYGAALVLFLLLGRGGAAGNAKRPKRLSAADVADAIGAAGEAIVRIGVCIVLCRVLLALLEGAGAVRLLAAILPASEETLTALLSGFLEMSSGCALAARLPVPFSLRLGLCAFFSMFGGLSILLQIRSFSNIPSLWRFLLERLLLAAAAGALCCGLCRLLPVAAAEAMAGPHAVLRRAGTLLELVISGGFGLLCGVYFALLTRSAPKKRQPGDNARTV